MPEEGRKKVRVQYRKFADPAGAFKGKTLQAALTEAMLTKCGAGTIGEAVSARQCEIDTAYGTIVLNTIKPEVEFFFGELIRFDPGADLPLIQVGSNLKSYNLAQAKAPDGHEPLRGVLYFMAMGDHVVLLESEVSTSRAEGYLSWLLGPTSKVVADGAHVILDAELSAEAGGSGLSDIDEIVIRPRPFAAEPISDGGVVEETTVSSQRHDVSQGSTLEVLRAAGMDDTDIQKIVGDSVSIEVTLQIRFKDSRRRKSLVREDARRLLRNIPDDDMVLTGRGGRQKNGKIVKLTYPANVQTTGSLLVTSDVARALNEAFKYFVSNGYIDG